jgi:hypothetical protein
MYSTRLLLGAMDINFLSQLSVSVEGYYYYYTTSYYSRKVSMVVVRGKRERNLPKRTLTSYSDPLFRLR